MQASDVSRAVRAAMSTAAELKLRVDDAVVLQESNRITLRLRPCDVLARVADGARHAGAAFELDVARRLAASDSPVAALEPRVEPRAYMHDGFVVTLWTYYEPRSPQAVTPSQYAQALRRLHAGMRSIDLPAPHFTDRVAEAQRLVGSPADTPELEDPDRELLSFALRQLRLAFGQQCTAEQLLHGEPHPGNVLSTKHGLLFADLETCCRGPVEFDVAHAPDAVSEHYPDTDPDLLRTCRALTLAMVATWRWHRDDHLPNGRHMGRAFLNQLRKTFGTDADFG